MKESANKGIARKRNAQLQMLQSCYNSSIFLPKFRKERVF